jgi:ATP adenylyltransferase
MSEKPLWAPWRMEYILRKKGEGCVFCAIASHDASLFREDLVLVAQPHAFVCLNRYPFASGHLLVVARRHVSGLEELRDEEYLAMQTLVRDSVKALKAAVSPDGVNVGFNLGKAAGAGIADHLHGHVVPRWVGDSNFMPVIGDTRVMPQYLDDAWKTLRPAFESVPGEKGRVA